MKSLLCVVVLALCLSVVLCKPASKDGVEPTEICKVEKDGKVTERECTVGACSTEGKVIPRRKILGTESSLSA